LVTAAEPFKTGGFIVQNYRCVVILGQARPIRDPEEKAAALLKLTEHIIPGRTQHARAASDKELSQTAVLAIDLNEVSAKAGPHVSTPLSQRSPIRCTHHLRCIKF
jgi:hypothetical protein